MVENKPEGPFDGGHGDFESALAEFESVSSPEPEAAAEHENLSGAPDAQSFREGAKRMGLSEERINELLPANLRTLEEVEAARQSLLAEVQYEDAVNKQFVEYIKEDMAKIQQARDMSDLMDLRRELSDLNPSFAAKSEAEQTELLLGKARTDARIMEAWNNRYDSPRAWTHAKDALAAWTSTVSPYYDEEITADRMAVAHAVRGRSHHRAEPVQPALGQMSDSEFNQHLADEYGIG